LWLKVFIILTKVTTSLQTNIDYNKNLNVSQSGANLSSDLCYKWIIKLSQLFSNKISKSIYQKYKVNFKNMYYLEMEDKT